MSDEARRKAQQLGQAIARLKEALAQPGENPLAVDGTIQRFEFTIELFWKVLKRLLAAEGVETTTPREALQRAFQAGWLEDETAWLEMLRNRNRTSQLYDDAQARGVYEAIKRDFGQIEKAYAVVQRRLAGG
jgi:nucleotidyltransferase substrate binding protein (TIGR01987 family)